MTHALLLIAMEIHCAFLSKGMVFENEKFQACLTEKLSCAVTKDVYKEDSPHVSLKVGNCLVEKKP